MAKASDNSCSSEDDEYSDPLEEAASAGARLSVPEKASRGVAGGAKPSGTV